MKKSEETKLDNISEGAGSQFEFVNTKTNKDMSNESGRFDFFSLFLIDKSVMQS